MTFRTIQLQQTDLRQTLQTLCTELVITIFQNSTSLHTLNAKKSGTLREEARNESVCYFSGILLFFFFSPQPMGHLLKCRKWPA